MASSVVKMFVVCSKDETIRRGVYRYDVTDRQAAILGGVY